MSFAWPWCFLLLALPWLLSWGIPWFWRRSRLSSSDLSSPGLTSSGLALRLPIDNVALSALSTLATPAVTRRSDLNLARLIWLLLVLAIARPQLVDDHSATQHSGRNLMLAIDLSASMATTDLTLNGKAITRLAAAKSLLDEFLQQRFGDRVGLIVFGKQAYLHTPLTFDLQAVRDALMGVEIGLVGNETALGDSVALAVKQLSVLPEHKRVLVLLTDGANTAGTLAPLRAAWLAQRDQVRVHALGIGASVGGVSMEKQPANTLDETTLEKLTKQTGGRYLRATKGEQIQDFFSQLDNIEPMPAADLSKPLRECYVWPLAAAFMLMTFFMLRQGRKQ